MQQQFKKKFINSYQRYKIACPLCYIIIIIYLPFAICNKDFKWAITVEVIKNVQ